MDVKKVTHMQNAQLRRRPPSRGFLLRRIESLRSPPLPRRQHFESDVRLDVNASTREEEPVVELGMERDVTSVTGISRTGTGSGRR